jgi:hypothetical protein
MIALLLAAAIAAPVPAVVRDAAPHLQKIDRLEKMPAGAIPVIMAEPGAKFNATDVIIDTSLPGRRMIVAGCAGSLCVVNFECGGIAHVFYVTAEVNSGGRWKSIWTAEVRQPLTFAELQKLLGTDVKGFTPAYWC